MLEICSDLSKTDLKIYYFCQHSKKAKKWPNGNPAERCGGCVCVWGGLIPDRGPSLPPIDIRQLLKPNLT